MKELFIVMVTYRRFDYFARTMESLLPTLPAGSKMVIVYNREGKSEDDFQYEGYLRKLTAVNSMVEVLDTGTNNGWGHSMNEALEVYDEWQDYEYVLEVNNDVTFETGWFYKARAIMEKYPKLGILGLWKHKNHGVREDLGDLLVKDDMPAVAWLFRSHDLEQFLPFREKGSTRIRGGNGEDSAMVEKVHSMGLWVGGPKNDLAQHIDGYDDQQGKDNKAYL